MALRDSGARAEKLRCITEQDKIIIRGLRQNKLKNVSLDVPKGKIVVFTGTPREMAEHAQTITAEYLRRFL